MNDKHRYATFDTDAPPSVQMQIKEAGSSQELFAQLAKQLKEAGLKPIICETCCHAFHHQGKTICNCSGEIEENVHECNGYVENKGIK